MFMFFVVVGLGEIAQLQFQFVQFASTIPGTRVPFTFTITMLLVGANCSM